MPTLLGTNISHLGKRKIIFKMPFLGDMLVPWRVFQKSINPDSMTMSSFLQIHGPSSLGQFLIAYIVNTTRYTVSDGRAPHCP